MKNLVAGFCFLPPELIKPPKKVILLQFLLYKGHCLLQFLGMFIEINDIYNNDVCIVDFPAKEDKDHCYNGQR